LRRGLVQSRTDGSICLHPDGSPHWCGLWITPGISLWIGWGFGVDGVWMNCGYLRRSPATSSPAFRKLPHDREYRLEGIVRRGAVFTGCTTDLAPVHHHEAAPLFLHGHRPHHTAAGLPPISRVPVHVPAPETMGAVVGETRARHLLPAPAAGEVLDAPLKSLFFHHTIAEKYGVSRVYPVTTDL